MVFLLFFCFLTTHFTASRRSTSIVTIVIAQKKNKQKFLALDGTLLDTFMKIFLELWKTKVFKIDPNDSKSFFVVVNEPKTFVSKMGIHFDNFEWFTKILTNFKFGIFLRQLLRHKIIGFQFRVLKLYFDLNITCILCVWKVKKIS